MPEKITIVYDNNLSLLVLSILTFIAVGEIYCLKGGFTQAIGIIAIHVPGNPFSSKKRLISKKNE